MDSENGSGKKLLASDEVDQRDCKSCIVNTFLSPRYQRLIEVTVLSLLSLAGSIVLFKWLSSFASVKGTGWELGGAVGGFLFMYSLLVKSMKTLATPVLTEVQTIELIKYFQEALIGRILLEACKVIGDVEVGREKPDVAELSARVRDIRHQSREGLRLFDTPMGRLNKIMETAYEPYVEEDTAKGFQILLRNDLPYGERIRRLAEMAYGRAEALRSSYIAAQK